MRINGVLLQGTARDVTASSVKGGALPDNGEKQLAKRRSSVRVGGFL